MALNLLQMIQEVMGRLNKLVPAAVAGSTDSGVNQCRGIMNEFLEDLVTRKYWQVNTLEAKWTVTAATEDQGAIDTLAPNGYKGMLPDTFYNRTRILKVIGGLTAAEWQANKARNTSGPVPTFRIRQNRMLFNPNPVVGEVYAFEYFSSYFVLDSDGITFRKYWQKDTDTCTLDDALPMAFLTWKWLSRKGLDYSEDFRKYESMLAVETMREKRPRPIDMSDGNPNPVGPGIIVSPGSWPVH